jgi:hypothetical protein
VALLGSGLVSDVKRGENGGRKLTHDFTVLEWQKATLEDATKKSETTLVFREAKGAMALAAWIEETGSGQILQSTGGWLSP